MSSHHCQLLVLHMYVYAVDPIWGVSFCNVIPINTEAILRCTIITLISKYSSFLSRLYLPPPSPVFSSLQIITLSIILYYYLLVHCNLSPLPPTHAFYIRLPHRCNVYTALLLLHIPCIYLFQYRSSISALLCLSTRLIFTYSVPTS